MVNVSIVVLHYNNEKLTNACIDSILLNTTGSAYRIIVVDNNSDKPYVNPEVTVIRNNNKYSVSGMNFGFLYALENCSPDYIVNFDNDIICLAGWLEPLVKSMEDPKVGIVGGKQWDKEQKLFRCVGMDMVGGHLYCNAPEKTQEVFWIQGSAVMFRASMMRLIGLHDERFKILCSDSDYCFHAKDRGWKVVFVADSNVVHIGGASYTSVCESWETDNRLLVRKWSGIEAMQNLRGLPFSVKDDSYIKASFKVVKNNDKEVDDRLIPSLCTR
jgi:GT2 family glycosyltransferase